MKDIEIKFRKLGKHRAAGLAWCEINLAEIDERLKGEEGLYVLIHEIIHLQNPKWSEIKVEGHAKQLASLLWKHNYRKTDQ